MIAKVEGDGRYIPDWERLYDAAKRVAASRDVNITAAKIDLCRVISDRKIKTRIIVGKVIGEPAEHIVGTARLDGFSLPMPFEPRDVDWPKSRPRKPFKAHRSSWDRPVLWVVEYMEVRRDDVSAVLCPANEQSKKQP